MVLEVCMNFSDRLKKLRAEGGLTVREVANVLDVAPSTISNYEQDYRRPDFDTLGKLADYFDVSLDYLLARTDDPHGTDELPKKVYRLRKSLGKSKEEFAAMVNLTPDEVEAVEEGRLDEDKRWYVWISLIIGGCTNEDWLNRRGS
jgi:transcriptional regulator with XRE-family HTH domain